MVRWTWTDDEVCSSLQPKAFYFTGHSNVLLPDFGGPSGFGWNFLIVLQTCEDEKFSGGFTESITYNVICS